MKAKPHTLSNGDFTTLPGFRAQMAAIFSRIDVAQNRRFFAFGRTSFSDLGRLAQVEVPQAHRVMLVLS